LPTCGRLPIGLLGYVIFRPCYPGAFGPRNFMKNLVRRPIGNRPQVGNPPSNGVVRFQWADWTGLSLISRGSPRRGCGDPAAQAADIHTPSSACDFHLGELPWPRHAQTRGLHIRPERLKSRRDCVAETSRRLPIRPFQPEVEFRDSGPDRINVPEPAPFPDAPRSDPTTVRSDFRSRGGACRIRTAGNRKASLTIE
jgi:hypothetical protein